MSAAAPAFPERTSRLQCVVQQQESFYWHASEPGIEKSFFCKKVFFRFLSVKGFNGF